MDVFRPKSDGSRLLQSSVVPIPLQVRAPVPVGAAGRSVAARGSPLLQALPSSSPRSPSGPFQGVLPWP